MDTLFWLLVSLMALFVSLIAVAALDEWLTRSGDLPPRAETRRAPPPAANDNSRLAHAINHARNSS
jgi:hypothetical protein